MLAPHFVVEQHADVITVNRVALEHPDEAVGVQLEIVRRQRRNGIALGHVIPHDLQEIIPLDGSLRDVFLWRTNALLNDVLGNADAARNKTAGRI